MKTTWEKLIRLGIIVINSSMKRVQVYAVIMLSVLGKSFFFLVIATNKKQLWVNTWQKAHFYSYRLY